MKRVLFELRFFFVSLGGTSLLLGGLMFVVFSTPLYLIQAIGGAMFLAVGLVMFSKAEEFHRA